MLLRKKFKFFKFQAKVHAFQLSLKIQKILQKRNPGSNKNTVVPQPEKIVHSRITFIN